MAERIDRKKERETKKKEHSEYNNRRTLINKINRSFQSVFFFRGGRFDLVWLLGRSAAEIGQIVL